MDCLEQAKILVGLSAYNPCFKENFDDVKTALLRATADKSKEREARELISALNDKTLDVVTDIRTSLDLYRIQQSNSGSSGSTFERTSVISLVTARDVCKKFMSVLSVIFNKGYCDVHSKIPAAYLVQTNTKLKKLYEDKNEEFWKYFMYYREYFINVVKRNMVGSSVARSLVEDLKLYDNWYLVEKYKFFNNDDKTMTKLDMFSENSKGNSDFDLDRALYELDYLFLAQPTELITKYQNYLTTLRNLLNEDKITNDEEKRYRTNLAASYNSFISELPKKNYLSIISLYYNYMTEKIDVINLLQFSRDELIEAYEFAVGFCSAYTDSYIEKEVTDFIFINNALLLQKYKQVDRALLEKNTTQVLKILLDYNIIDLDKYYKYKKELLGYDVH